MVKVHGTKELKRAIRRAPAVLQEEALKEVRKSTQSMYQGAKHGFDTASNYGAFYHGKAGMQSVTGAARRFYRWSVSKAALRGRVGLLTPRARKKAFYLRFFMDGTVNQPARPVHDDAFEAEREPYIQNQTRALKRVLTKIFG